MCIYFSCMDSAACFYMHAGIPACNQGKITKSQMLPEETATLVNMIFLPPSFVFKGIASHTLYISIWQLIKKTIWESLLSSNGSVFLLYLKLDFRKSILDINQIKTEPEKHNSVSIKAPLRKLYCVCRKKKKKRPAISSHLYIFLYERMFKG